MAKRAYPGKVWWVLNNVGAHLSKDGEDGFVLKVIAEGHVAVYPVMAHPTFEKLNTTLCSWQAALCSGGVECHIDGQSVVCTGVAEPPKAQRPENPISSLSAQLGMPVKVIAGDHRGKVGTIRAWGEITNTVYVTTSPDGDEICVRFQSLDTI